MLNPHPNPNRQFDGPVYAGLHFEVRDGAPIPPTNFRHVDTLAAFGTHFPVLAACLARYVERPEVAHLEHGCGFFSTFLMRTMLPKSELWSYDSQEEWLSIFRPALDNHHCMHYTPVEGSPTPWAKILPEGKFGVVFVDGNLADRVDFCNAVADRCDLLVVHDWEQPAYGWSKVKQFRYTYSFQHLFPWTAVLSDVGDPHTFLPPS